MVDVNVDFGFGVDDFKADFSANGFFRALGLGQTSIDPCDGAEIMSSSGVYLIWRVGLIAARRIPSRVDTARDGFFACFL